jgi:solute carrier family 45 protein 1/2/4
LLKLKFFLILKLNIIVFFEKFLIERFSAKTLYFFTHFVYSICIGGVYFVTNIYAIMALSSTLGFVLTANYTLPYSVISEFHEDKEYRKQSAAGTKRGIGTDCALLSSVYFLSQFTVAAITGLLTSTFGNSVIVIVSSVLGLAVSFWVAVFMIFPKQPEEKKDVKK